MVVSTGFAVIRPQKRVVSNFGYWVMSEYGFVEEMGIMSCGAR